MVNDQKNYSDFEVPKTKISPNRLQNMKKSKKFDKLLEKVDSTLMVKRLKYEMVIEFVIT